MNILTEDQILHRWDTIPDELREALVSDANSDFIWKTSEAQGVVEENIPLVIHTAASVLMGFIHPDDVASELVEIAKIDPKAAGIIQASLKQKIFTPLSKFIDSIYQPASSMDAVAIPVAPGPVTLGLNIPSPNVAAVDLSSPKMFDISTSMKASQIPTPAKPDLGGKGWSKSRTEDPVIETQVSAPASFSNIPTPAPAKPFVPAPQSDRKPVASGTVLGEFERLNINPKSSSSLPPTPTAPVAPKAPVMSQSVGAPTPAPQPSLDPAPAMFAQETQFNAAAKNTAFHLSRPGADAQVEFDQTKSREKVMPAVLEFSKGKSTTSSTPITPTMGAVHYTEFKSSLAAVPTANSGPRTVSELTAPTPTPTSIPTPVAPAPLPTMNTTPTPVPLGPVPMRPPVPAAPTLSSTPIPPPPLKSTTPTAIPASSTPEAKVIVKDFL